jgi:hypothetical protein
MRNLKPLMAAMVLIALAVGAYWWVTSNKELMWALTRGSVNKTSSSTAPYDVALRIAHKAGIPFGDDVPAKEWILRLPRNYVTREMGKNGSVFRMADNRYFVTLQTNVATDGQAFTPSVGKPADQLIIRSMFIHLQNDEANELIAKNDLCVPSNKEKDILGPLGYTGARNNPCGESILRCTIQMQLNGWSVELGVTKDLYVDPNQACALARKFLDQYTVKRDELR